MPLQQTSGAASYDAFGGGVPVAAKYIEDFFQPWLRTGTGSSATVTTGLNGAINKTMVWTKSRSAATNHKLTDNVRGATKALSSNMTDAEVTDSQGLTAFSSTGYTIGTNTDYNNSGATYVDFQWVATPKFFDVVTWTGDGTNNRKIAHNIGGSVGVIIAKRTNTATNWAFYHKDIASASYLQLNTTVAPITGSPGFFGDGTVGVAPTSSVFTVSASLNASGGTYVAYIFAHNAGGFGLTGTDNVISCGSFTTDASGNASVTLGYEPQWMITKASSQAENWYINDVMRGYNAPSQGAVSGLSTNTSNAEAGTRAQFISSTGFTVVGGLSASQTYIYIAIRRGPNKPPTSGTQVYNAIAQTASDGGSATVGFPPDLTVCTYRTAFNANYMGVFQDRLRGYATANTSGTYPSLVSNATQKEDALSPGNPVIYGVTNAYDSIFYGTNAATGSTIVHAFRRAPGFHDQICYTGTGANKTEAHNLGAQPQLWIVKRRNSAGSWTIGSTLLNNTEKIVMPSPNGRMTDATAWNSTFPTATNISLGTQAAVNADTGTFVAYLWATVAGVSKVGTYTGNGSSQTIDCGFTGGSRFVMIIRATASTAQDIYIWDSARGIVAGNDPRLSLNTTAAEVTSLDTIDTAASGFVVNTDASNVNVNGAVYLYLSIA